MEIEKKATTTIKNTPKAADMWDYSKNSLDSAAISINSHKYASL